MRGGGGLVRRGLDKGHSSGQNLHLFPAVRNLFAAVETGHVCVWRARGVCAGRLASALRQRDRERRMLVRTKKPEAHDRYTPIMCADLILVQRKCYGNGPKDLICK